MSQDRGRDRERDRSHYQTASEGNSPVIVPVTSHHLSMSDAAAAEPMAVMAGEIERPHSAGEVTEPTGKAAPAKRGRVRFNSRSEVNDLKNQRFSFPLQEESTGRRGAGSAEVRGGPAGRAYYAASPGPSYLRSPTPTKIQFSPLRKTIHHTTRHGFEDGSTRDRDRDLDRDTDGENPFADAARIVLQAPVPRKPRPSVLRANSASSFTEDMMLMGDAQNDEDAAEKNISARAAHQRAQRVALMVGSDSDLPLRNLNSTKDSSPSDRTNPSSPLRRNRPSIRLDDIPLMDMDRDGRYNNGGLDSDEDDTEEQKEQKAKSATAEAHKLVRSHTGRAMASAVSVAAPDSPMFGPRSGAVTPRDEMDYAEEYVSRPDHYRTGVLSSLLKLYNHQAPSHHKRTSSYASVGGESTPGSSGQSTPRHKPPKWYNQKNKSTDTLSNLVEASSQLAAHGRGGLQSPGAGPSHAPPKRPGMGSRQHSGGKAKLDQAFEKLKRPRLEDEIRITVHIAETLSRQKYLIRLCRALMAYGAPTHRLEEYMRMTARVLELDGQFLYIPGCMLVSFDDASTHTTEVKLVRTNQGVDLGKLKDVHEIYKEVVHDVIGVEEATQRLDAIIREKPKHHKWLLVLVYGFASACVGPFAFESNFIDLPIAFVLGCVLGFLQLIVAPKSDLYANVFEISAAVCTSFLARAFGSIRYGGGDKRLFCFSALAQSSIALILPGYIILCGALELQSKSIVAGSVRMFYAIIYSLFLGFGITIGTALYGVMDRDAVSSTSCANPMSTYLRFIFVPLFTMCLAVINQAKWKQTPVMLVISFAGYLVNFFTSRRFPGNSQISQTLGAFTVGVMGNLYSRLRHGVAAAALLPAIFVQVPSGLAAGGSLLSGLTSANVITKTNGTGNGNSTAAAVGTATSAQSTDDLNSIVFNVGYSMIQVAIGISVGLFLSALIIYPLGKRRSGLFSF